MGWVNGNIFVCDWCGKRWEPMWMKGGKRRTLSLAAILQYEDPDATAALGYTSYKSAGPCCYKDD